jgi:hypothetical protein
MNESICNLIKQNNKNKTREQLDNERGREELLQCPSYPGNE